VSGRLSLALFLTFRDDFWAAADGRCPSPPLLRVAYHSISPGSAVLRPYLSELRKVFENLVRNTHSEHPDLFRWWSHSFFTVRPSFISVLGLLERNMPCSTPTHFSPLIPPSDGSSSFALLGVESSFEARPELSSLDLSSPPSHAPSLPPF